MAGVKRKESRVSRARTLETEGKRPLRATVRAHDPPMREARASWRMVHRAPGMRYFGRHRRLRSRGRRSGFTLIEIAVVLSILTVAMAMFARTLASSAQLDPLVREG